MRANRRENHDSQGREHDGTAGAQRVGGGAGRRSDDQTIGAISAERLLVRVHLELEHSAQRAAVERHIIDRDKAIYAPQVFARALDGDLQGYPVINLVVSLENPIDGLLRFFDSDLGEKAQPAEVDTENRRTPSGTKARDAEQRAITSEHHDKVRTLGKLLARHRLSLDASGDFRFRERLNPLGANVLGEFLRDRDGLGLIALNYQPN